MRKRGRTPKTDALPGYVRFTKAVELFQPLTRNMLNYRVRMGDIKTQEDEDGKMYEIDSLLKMRATLIEEQFKEKVKKQAVPDVDVDWVRPEDVPSGLA